MADHHDFTRQVRRTTIISVALGACFIFGIIVLVGGDWLPGGIIVAASTVALVREIPIIRALCSTEYPASPPDHKAAK
jgi:hypothetical protein